MRQCILRFNLLPLRRYDYPHWLRCRSAAPYLLLLADYRLEESSESHAVV